MGKITFFHNSDRPFVAATEAGGSRVRHPGSTEELQLLEVYLNPNEEATAHAHKEAEIMYVVKGEMSFGAQTLKVGDSVSIGALTMYKFKAGPSGVTFINFRPRQDNTYFSGEQLNEYNKLDDPAAKAAMERRLAEEFMARINWKDETGTPVGID